MSLYESNYLRLLQLIPEVERLDGCFRSRVAGECDLYVEILERCRYTMTLSLTYRFEAEHGADVEPNMVVRIYVDGAMAEAMGKRSGYCHDRRELDARWRRNIILNKWLEFLSDQGHLILER
ncbi:MAG: DUF1249 domain-containing protein [Gammaproteobacteria bacterium]|nr:DUF1249 domain-containing protein [Gammaproteobacteria bacterium]MDH5302983.1 DUF1249 domain-containing protein [Gammaproteobacteria bacterium]MDH5321270.1 DUF1249 domain-containing protein [Gammaproteobacteria bacterium]